MEAYIDLTKLKRGSTILLETVEAVYEIVLKGPKTGVVEIQGTLRFIKPTKAVVRGSVDCLIPESKQSVLRIEKGKCLNIIHGEKDEHTLTTSAVVSAKIIASDKSWNYEAIENPPSPPPPPPKPKKEETKDEPPDDTIDYSQ